MTNKLYVYKIMHVYDGNTYLCIYIHIKFVYYSLKYNHRSLYTYIQYAYMSIARVLTFSKLAYVVLVYIYSVWYISLAQRRAFILNILKFHASVMNARRGV